MGACFSDANNKVETTQSIQQSKTKAQTQESSMDPNENNSTITGDENSAKLANSQKNLASRNIAPVIDISNSDVKENGDGKVIMIDMIKSLRNKLKVMQKNGFDTGDAVERLDKARIDAEKNAGNGKWGSVKIDNVAFGLRTIAGNVPTLASGIKNNEKFAIISGVLGTVGGVLMMAGPKGAVAGGLLQIAGAIVGCFSPSGPSQADLIDDAVNRISSRIDEVIAKIDQLENKIDYNSAKHKLSTIKTEAAGISNLIGTRIQSFYRWISKNSILTETEKTQLLPIPNNDLFETFIASLGSFLVDFKDVMNGSGYLPVLQPSFSTLFASYVELVSLYQVMLLAQMLLCYEHDMPETATIIRDIYLPNMETDANNVLSVLFVNQETFQNAFVAEMTYFLWGYSNIAPKHPLLWDFVRMPSRILDSARFLSKTVTVPTGRVCLVNLGDDSETSQLRWNELLWASDGKLFLMFGKNESDKNCLAIYQCDTPFVSDSAKIADHKDLPSFCEDEKDFNENDLYLQIANPHKVERPFYRMSLHYRDQVYEPPSGGGDEMDFLIVPKLGGNVYGTNCEGVYFVVCNAGDPENRGRSNIDIDFYDCLLHSTPEPHGANVSGRYIICGESLGLFHIQNS